MLIDPSFYGFRKDGVIMRDSQMRELGFFNRKNFLMEKNLVTRDKR